ncbi:MAG: hypothetical protein WDM94_14625 [Bauldia sp.]
MDVSLVVSVASFAVVVIVAAVFVFALRGQGGPARQTDGGIRVPLRAAYGSRKGFGLLGSHNNFNPLLLLYDDRIEYRVLKRTSVAYSGIAGVDAVTGWGRAAVVLSFTDSNFRFVGNTGGRAALAEVLRLLRDKGSPLTDAARVIAEAPAG